MGYSRCKAKRAQACRLGPGEQPKPLTVRNLSVDGFGALLALESKHAEESKYTSERLAVFRDNSSTRLAQGQPRRGIRPEPHPQGFVRCLHPLRPLRPDLVPVWLGDRPHQPGRPRWRRRTEQSTASAVGEQPSQGRFASEQVELQGLCLTYRPSIEGMNRRVQIENDWRGLLPHGSGDELEKPDPSKGGPVFLL